MKLVQLNIWGGKLQYQIVDFINRVKPDIICMQEVHNLPGASGAVFVTLDEIQEQCGFKYRYMSPCYTSNYQRRKNEYGNAILSRYPLNNTQTIFTSGTYNNDFDLTEDDYNVRNLQVVQVDLSGKQLWVLNHHGYLVLKSKLGNSETLRQMKLIDDHIQSLSGPLVLTGDFNLSPASESIGILNAHLRNLSVESGVESTYSQFNNHYEICDYIFVNDTVKVQRFTVEDELVSDHKALILDFDI